MDPVGIEALAAVGTGRAPIDDHGIGVALGDGGDGVVDLLLPRLGHVGVDQDDALVGPERKEQCLQLGRRVGAVGPELEDQSVPHRSLGPQLGNGVLDLVELLADLGIDDDAGQHALEVGGGVDHDRVTDGGDALPGRRGGGRGGAARGYRDGGRRSRVVDPAREDTGHLAPRIGRRGVDHPEEPQRARRRR